MRSAAVLTFLQEQYPQWHSAGQILYAFDEKKTKLSTILGKLEKFDLVEVRDQKGMPRQWRAKMITIKLSSDYNKLPLGFELSKLLEVLPVNLEDLHIDFLNYDTTRTDGTQYPLPASGKYMILILSPSNAPYIIFTTIRSQKGRKGIDKLAYYRKHIGEMVACKIIS